MSHPRRIVRTSTRGTTERTAAPMDDRTVPHDIDDIERQAAEDEAEAEELLGALAEAGLE